MDKICITEFMQGVSPGAADRNSLRSVFISATMCDSQPALVSAAAVEELKVWVNLLLLAGAGISSIDAEEFDGGQLLSFFFFFFYLCGFQEGTKRRDWRGWV